jgi:hypothetical protein
LLLFAVLPFVVMQQTSITVDIVGGVDCHQIPTSQRQFACRWSRIHQFAFLHLNRHTLLVTLFIYLGLSIIHPSAAQSGGNIAMAKHAAFDDTVVKLNWQDSPSRMNRGSALPTCDGANGFFDGIGQHLYTGLRGFSVQAIAFTDIALGPWFTQGLGWKKESITKSNIVPECEVEIGPKVTAALATAAAFTAVFETPSQSVLFLTLEGQFFPAGRGFIFHVLWVFNACAFVFFSCTAFLSLARNVTSKQDSVNRHSCNSIRAAVGRILERNKLIFCHVSSAKNPHIPDFQLCFVASLGEFLSAVRSILVRPCPRFSEALLWIRTNTVLLVFFMTILQCPSVADSQSCPVSATTTSHCTGVFKLGESHVPMLYMTEGSSAWVAVKYTSNTAAAIVETAWTSTSKNFYVSRSTLRASISVASDILMVESGSSVYANMASAAAFSKVRDNILGGCYWFKDTHGGNTLTGWMSPYAIGAQIPDAQLGYCNQYVCCSQSTCSSVNWDLCFSTYDCSAYIFDSCASHYSSHARLTTHYRFNGNGNGGWGVTAPHSIWLRIPLNLQISSSLPPLSVSVSQGLIAMYTADSWRPAESPTTASWLDLSGAGNHVTEIRGTPISVARPVGAPAYIYGNTTASMGFPEGILPSAEYTLFFVARYNGANRGRILQGVSTNWFSGFYPHPVGRAGVAYHGGCEWIANVDDKHGFDWVIGADRSNSFRSNGEERRTNAAPCAAFDRLTINYSPVNSENSDFAIQSVLVYNRKLTNVDVMNVEAWLTSLQSAFTPANVQASAREKKSFFSA